MKKIFILPIILSLLSGCDIKNKNSGLGQDLKIKTVYGEEYLIKGKSIQNQTGLNKQENLVNLVAMEYEERLKIDELFFKYTDEILSLQRYCNFIYSKSEYFVANSEEKRLSYINDCIKNNQERFEIKDEWIEKQRITIEEANVKWEKAQEKLVNLEKKFMAESPKGIHFELFSFRPIFIDLNKKKNLLSEVNIYCIHPNLNEEVINLYKKWEVISEGKINTNKKIKSLIKDKFCKKYARFQ
tara:strand:- start:3642 stop:4367 length:726 start_codon:yes stop_codon:yes gene_type:complete